MIRTGDYEATLARFARSGIEAAYKAELPGSGRWAYLDARAQISSYIEVYDMQPSIAQMWSLMEAAHRNWDGERPVRNMADLA
ncbi:hypothetical protein [Sphingobium aromaticivastans]|uniref:hypothetical protein n=1 Tax=Sphingobium aromaticivastans TaxID=1778665 RepID=UPI00301B3ED3